MPPKSKPFGELEIRQRTRIVEPIEAILKSHCPSLADATALLQVLFRKCKSFLPGLSMEPLLCAQVLSFLGELREAVSERLRTSQVSTPSISVADLDRAVCRLPSTRDQIKEWGYNISARRYTAAQAAPPPALSLAPRNVGGRPSKVNNEKCISAVRTVIAKYLKESERIVVIGRGVRRRMVLAKHLTKKRYSIFLAERELQDLMGKESFRRIMKIHFPHVRNPRRKTDVCHLVAILDDMSICFQMF